MTQKMRFLKLHPDDHWKPIIFWNDGEVFPWFEWWFNSSYFIEKRLLALWFDSRYFDIAYQCCDSSLWLWKPNIKYLWGENHELAQLMIDLLDAAEIEVEPLGQNRQKFNLSKAHPKRLFPTAFIHDKCRLGCYKLPLMERLLWA